ncbi:Tat (twin-arginine translocation) pathway signal sequence [Chitinophaga jiangningensis]|uniref:Tat (Twin-arginine translocation) pathway signal sequence n=1 Tax=Chitinophaga jiangningensis TaxID=1419482 RepID=A0A1M7K5I1_9BACT|nr:Gfo/Idh/MocA family oxidoreductase [Chitinophaga jiangningensis]SHM60516.1 Tat (twin-arginine translocation) pathway signal sequence [Chitinophaga jiangningensis]
MKNNRRDFLKLAGLAGLGLTGTALLPGETLAQVAPGSKNRLEQIRRQAARKYTQRFNMCGYAAPKIDTVRIGYIGLGNRGGAAVERISYLDGIEIKALCDIRPEKATEAKARIKRPGHNPQLYAGTEDAWKQVCERKDIDLIYICTPWSLHTPMAVYAMKQGKHVAMEIPAATSMEECWQLVETSETTRKHCVMLENCCYDFFELLTLNMARQGFFGEIVHGEGAYIHDIGDSLFDKTKRYDLWRLKENAKRNGNLYPTHGLGPICQVMNINRGDSMEYLTSVSSNDFMLEQLAEETAAKDPSMKEWVGKPFRGNMNVTTIRTRKGRTIMVQHDVTSHRPYSRIHLVSGTKAVAQKYPLEPRIAVSHEGWVSPEEFNKLEEKYTPPIIHKLGEMAKQIGGHGGMDFLMDWRLIDCLRNGLPMDMDVYDAASWTAVGLLSEWSVANRSNSIDMPDFTAGAWKTNKPVDISLTTGGTTTARTAS